MCSGWPPSPTNMTKASERFYRLVTTSLGTIRVLTCSLNNSMKWHLGISLQHDNVKSNFIPILINPNPISPILPRKAFHKSDRKHAMFLSYFKVLDHHHALNHSWEPRVEKRWSNEVILKSNEYKMGWNFNSLPNVTQPITIIELSTCFRVIDRYKMVIVQGKPDITKPLCKQVIIKILLHCWTKCVFVHYSFESGESL